MKLDPKTITNRLFTHKAAFHKRLLGKFKPNTENAKRTQVNLDASDLIDFAFGGVFKPGLCNRNRSEDQKIKENKDSHKIIAASHSCSMVSGNSRASPCFQRYFGL